MTSQAIQNPKDIYEEVFIQMTNRTTAIAKNLRRKRTEAEKMLWNHIRAKQLHGLKFRGQEPVGKYIVDFVCYEKNFVIELDGGQHVGQKKGDNERDSWLASQGFRVLRFWDNEVLMNVEGVLENIKDQVSPSPSPSHQGRGNRMGGLPSNERKQPG